MVKLGIALTVLGFVLFFSFFIGVGLSMVDGPSVAHDSFEQFGEKMDRESAIAGVTFAMSAVGMMFMIGGPIVAVVGVARRGRRALGGVLSKLEQAAGPNIASQGPRRCAACSRMNAGGAQVCAGCSAPL